MRALSRFYLIIGIIIAAALLFYGLKYPTHLYSPGDLAKPHGEIKGCRECHAPFKGASSLRCLNSQCHPLSKIADSSKKIGGIHEMAKERDCSFCHTEHKGVRGIITIKFEHDKFAKLVCADCHKGPVDELHRDAGGLCQECHTTDKWSPAKFEHTKYFPITGDHEASCILCHERKNFKKYTCLGCHEHNTRKIRNEHIEEGVKDYGDCLRCHSFVIEGRRYGTAKVRIEDDD